MGSLATHFSAFLFLFPIGIRRLSSSFSIYFKSPTLFRAKTWYLSEPRWKNIDLYVLLITLPVAAFSEFFWSLTFSGKSTYQFTFSQHGAVLLLFWVILVSVILRESCDLLFVHDSLMLLLAGVAFLVEYSVTGRGYTGIAGRVYELLGALTLICGASCIALSFRPPAFFADVALSLCIVFKGTWVLQAGLLLFSDASVPFGCRKLMLLQTNETGDLQCDLEDDRLRGLALVDLLFIGHAVGIFILNIVLFGALFCNRNLRCGVGTSTSAAEMESENILVRSLPEYEIE